MFSKRNRWARIAPFIYLRDGATKILRGLYPRSKVRCRCWTYRESPAGIGTGTGMNIGSCCTARGTAAG